MKKNSGKGGVRGNGKMQRNRRGGKEERKRTEKEEKIYRSIDVLHNTAFAVVEALFAFQTLIKLTVSEGARVSKRKHSFSRHALAPLDPLMLSVTTDMHSRSLTHHADTLTHLHVRVNTCAGMTQHL